MNVHESIHSGVLAIVFAKQLAILGVKLVAENAQANPLTKVKPVTVIPECRLKNRTQDEQIIRI